MQMVGVGVGLFWAFCQILNKDNKLVKWAGNYNYQ